MHAPDIVFAIIDRTVQHHERDASDIIANVPIKMLLGVPRASLVGLTLQSLLCGFLLFLFPVAIYSIFSDRARLRISRPMIIATLLLFLVAILDWCVEFTRAYQAFMHEQADHGGATIYYANMNTPLAHLHTFFYMFQTFAADLSLVYRLYIIWAQSIWVVIIPLLCTVGTFATNAFALQQSMNNWDRGGWASIRIALHVAIPLALITTILCTSLIAYRLAKFDKQSRDAGFTSATFIKILWIFVESAAVVCLCLIANLWAFLAGSPVQATVVDVTIPLMAIIWCLIVLRICRAAATDMALDSVTRSVYMTSMAPDVTSDPCSVCSDMDDAISSTLGVGNSGVRKIRRVPLAIDPHNGSDDHHRSRCSIALSTIERNTQDGISPISSQH